LIDFTITTPPPLLAHIKSCSIKALVVTDNKRLDSLPEVPSAPEAGYPDLIVSSWFAMYGPKDLPEEVVKKLSSAIEKIMQSKEYREKAAQQGADAAYLNPQELKQYTADELKKWKQVIDAAGIKTQ